MANIILKESESEKIEKARNNINDYMEYVFGIVQSDLHREWQNFVQEKSWAMLLASQFHGKSVSSETLILLANGTLKKVVNIKKPTKVFSYNVNKHCFEIDIASSVESNGITPVVEIETKSGRSIKCTLNHPFYTFSGEWKLAENLREGDFVPVATDIYCKPRKLPDKIPAFLGYLIGDGYCCRPQFINVDNEIINDFKKVVQKLGWETSSRDNIHFDINCGKHGDKKSKRYIKNVLREYDLIDKLSQTKRVPTQIFKISNYQLAEFIGAYFSCDGTVDKNRLEVSFSSVSRELLQDISHLLLRFGIISVLKLKKGVYKDKRHLSWRLSIRSDMVLLFQEKIPFIGKKNSSLRLICIKLKRRKFSRSWLNVVPPEWRDFLKHSRGWFKQLIMGSVNFGVTKNGNDKEVAKRVAYMESNNELLEKLNAPIFWDKITKITSLLPEETFHLEIKNNQNYITNDFITHNSTQITLGVPTFGLGKNPNLRFGIIRQSDAMAQSAIAAIAETIAENPRYHRVFPHVKRDKKRSWKADRLTVKRDRIDESPSVHGMGILSSPSGRKDWLIFDDPCTHVTSIQQPAMRQNIKNSWTPFKNLLGPKGRLTYICTPYHEDDLTGVLRKHKAFEGAVFAKGINRNFDPIWEELWSREALIDWYNKEINPREFWRAFGLETISTDEQLISKEQLLATKVPWFDIPDSWPKFTGVDLAVIGGKENKRTSLGTITMDPTTKKKYIFDIRYGKYSSPDTAQELISIDQEYAPFSVFVESNNYQYALVEWIGASGLPGSTELSYKIKPYFTSIQKTNPRIGLPGLAAEFKRGLWNIPCDQESHGDNCRCGTCQFIREFSTYPIGEFSDVLMSIWLASRAANEYSNEPSVLFLGESKNKPMYARL